MCLSTVNKKIKKHKIGYKIFKHLLTELAFTSPIYHSKTYLLGKTYDALNGFTPYSSKTLPVIKAFDDRKYKAGFHYYLKLKDAKIYCDLNEAVIRVKVKNILATGIQDGFESGVCETITLDKIMYSKHKRSNGLTETFEKLIGDCFSTLIDDVKSYYQNPSDEILKSFENHMKNFSLFWKFVIICDSAERDSVFFKTTTGMWWKICKENWHPTVKKNFYKGFDILYLSNTKKPHIRRIIRDLYGQRFNIDHLILDL